MPFKIVRNDITKMNTEAIVNTANEYVEVGPGCDRAVYEAAGREALLAYRREHVGIVREGEAFLTPGFHLPAKYIIHAVSPLYVDGNHGEEALLRSCYRRSLSLAAENGIRSVAFPLISTGGFGYPKEEGMRIAVDEIHAFLLKSEMLIYLVVFDDKAVRMGRNIDPELEAYIDRNYVEKKRAEEYRDEFFTSSGSRPDAERPYRPAALWQSPSDVEPPGAVGYRPAEKTEKPLPLHENVRPLTFHKEAYPDSEEAYPERKDELLPSGEFLMDSEDELAVFDEDAFEEMERKLGERIAHMSDTFPEYLFYLIDKKGMQNSDVYKRAIVDKKVFSKIKNNPDYHPQKLTALCLCVGAKLTIDETRDLLARAGYALSPCDKTDIIFSYFIENGIYDMIDLDIQLEEHGLPCIIT